MSRTRNAMFPAPGLTNFGCCGLRSMSLYSMSSMPTSEPGTRTAANRDCAFGVAPSFMIAGAPLNGLLIVTSSPRTSR